MPKRKDITGQQFDELTVIEMLYNYQNKHRTYCKCIGIDGNEYIVRQDALVSGATHTIHGACSSGVFHDLTNKRFGKLIAIEPINIRGSNGGVKWKCKCDCGNIIYPPAHNLERGHTTSCGCNKIDYIESVKKDVIGQKYGLLTVLKEVYPENRRRRTMLCLCDCGETHICTLDDLSSGNTYSCGCYKISHGETYIKELLDNLDIEYTSQKRFDNCRDKRPLPFDFYLPGYNTCIEFDGIQHSISNDYFGGEEGLKIRQKHDNIKDEYCKQNNINLIRIPYYMKKDDINKTIINLTSPATTTV